MPRLIFAKFDACFAQRQAIAASKTQCDGRKCLLNIGVCGGCILDQATLTDTLRVRYDDDYVMIPMHPGFASHIFSCLAHTWFLQ